MRKADNSTGSLLKLKIKLNYHTSETELHSEIILRVALTEYNLFNRSYQCFICSAEK